MELGSTVQRLRQDRHLSLGSLADSSGVSVSMLSAVERGEKAPTVLVLSKIADGLGIGLAEVLPDTARSRVVVRRSTDHEVFDEPGGWRREILTPVIPGVNFEWIRATLPPDCDAGRFPGYAAGSHEFVHVESGRLDLTVDTETHQLKAGDTAYFLADVPHAYRNPGHRPCSYSVAALIMRPRVAGGD